MVTCGVCVAISMVSSNSCSVLSHSVCQPCSEVLSLPRLPSVMSQCESGATVWEWICGLRLEQYFEAFQSAGLTTLAQCHDLTDDQLEQMGVTLPGHRRRIVASLSKTYANGDPQPQLPESDGEQRVAETGPNREMPRDKPVPRERQVSRMGEERMRRGGEEAGGKSDRGREKPVPRERTKFRHAAAVDCPSSAPACPTFDKPLPPVPPRSTPNCPPQPFTSPQSPSALTPNPASSAMDTPPLHSPSSSQTRPETLVLLPPPRHPGSVSPLTSPSAKRTPPPLPPKASFKGAPPVTQRLPVQPPPARR